MTRSAADQDFQRRALGYVRHVLNETGLTPSGLARRAKVDPSTITRNLAGGRHKYTLSLKTIGRIAAVTGINPGPFLALDMQSMSRDFLSRLSAASDLTNANAADTAALIDVLAFLHLIRAEHRIDVPDRHFETLRALVNSPTEKAST